MYSSASGPSWNSTTTTTSSTAIRERNPSTSESASPTSPTGTSRGRLRGLSYLRSYTQNHILSREHHNQNSSSNNNSSRPTTVSRATSHPSPSSPTSTSAPQGQGSAASPATPASETTRQLSPTAQRSTNTITTELPSAGTNNQDNTGSTSGWLPTVGGHSGVSRIGTQPQSTATASSSAVLSANGSAAVASDLTASMARTRSAGIGASDMPQMNASGEHRQESPATPSGADRNGFSHQLPSIRFSAHQDPRAHRPSLVFSPMSRILPTGKEVIKVGRYSERDNQAPQTPNVPSSAPVGFKSKVVSRRHCEFWYTGGKWFIKDVKSSSGTFLNHIRLSSPGNESRPFPVNDGDIVQLGIDFKGGEEMIFRCVKIRVELNKGWQTGPSSFNVQSHKRLRELNNLKKQAAGAGANSSQDCSICLGPIAPCQSLFVAPCSHTWHYKCIRVIINGPHWPHFICPNCRTVADLEAELDDPDGDWEELLASEGEAEVEAGTKETPVPENVDDVSEQPTTFSRQPASSTEGLGGSGETEAVLNPVEVKTNLHLIDDELDVSDASSTSAQVHEDAAFISTDSPSISNSATPISQVDNASVRPVDIISRKALGSAPAGPSSRSDLGRGSPSPNGLHPASSDPLSGEGPMTPRNDAGPFVFDGSAGRASNIQLAIGDEHMNLTTVTNSPISPP